MTTTAPPRHGRRGPARPRQPRARPAAPRRARLGERGLRPPCVLPGGRGAAARPGQARRSRPGRRDSGVHAL